MRINCYGSTSMYSEFNFIGFLDTSSTSYDIKKDVSNSFNIPYESITGLYSKNKSDLIPYNYFHFKSGYDIYFIYDKVESTRSFLQKKIDRLEFSNKELNSNYSNLQSQYYDLINRNNTNQQQINQLNDEMAK